MAILQSYYSLLAERTKVIFQAVKFGIIGGAATLTHVVIFTLGIELWSIPPLWSNLLAFCIALLVSFLGHFYWTFRDQTMDNTTRRSISSIAFIRFTVVAITGLGLNSLAVWWVVYRLNLPYGYAIALMVTVTPLCTFMLSKFWAFSK